MYNKIVLQSSVQLKSACEVVWVFSHFVLTALKSHGNPDVCNDLVELKIKQDLPYQSCLIFNYVVPQSNLVISL